MVQRLQSGDARSHCNISGGDFTVPWETWAYFDLTLTASLAAKVNPPWIGHSECYELVRDHWLHSKASVLNYLNPLAALNPRV